MSAAAERHRIVQRPNGTFTNDVDIKNQLRVSLAMRQQRVVTTPDSIASATFVFMSAVEELCDDRDANLRAEPAAG